MAEKTTSKKRNAKPLLAAVLSFLVPGLGQAYAGESKRGIFYLGGAILIQFIGLFSISLFESYAFSARQTLWDWMTTPANVLRFGLNSLDVFLVLAWVFIAWGWVVFDAYKTAKSS